MEQFVGIKFIEACPMTPEQVEKETGQMMRTGGHAKDAAGYLVEYEGRYQSWSPKDAFDRAHYKNGELPIEAAIAALRQGFVLTQAGNPDEYYIAPNLVKDPEKKKRLNQMAFEMSGGIGDVDESEYVVVTDESVASITINDGMVYVGERIFFTITDFDTNDWTFITIDEFERVGFYDKDLGTWYGRLLEEVREFMTRFVKLGTHLRSAAHMTMLSSESDDVTTSALLNETQYHAMNVLRQVYANRLSHMKKSGYPKEMNRMAIKYLEAVLLPQVSEEITFPSNEPRVESVSHQQV